MDVRGKRPRISSDGLDVQEALPPRVLERQAAAQFADLQQRLKTAERLLEVERRRTKKLQERLAKVEKELAVMKAANNQAMADGADSLVELSIGRRPTKPFNQLAYQSQLQGLALVRRSYEQWLDFTAAAHGMSKENVARSVDLEQFAVRLILL